MKLDRIAQYLSTRIASPLPGAKAHDVMRAQAVGNIRPKFDAKSPPRPGSVLILLYQHEDQVKFPLIRRPIYQGTHSGQISLPGGKAEAGETFIDTALRETEEEIGVSRTLPQVIGALSNFLVIPSNFIITPIVATLPSIPVMTADPYEVAGILTASLDDLMTETSIYREEIPVGEYKMMAPHFKVNGAIVWGATAMMLNELRVLLNEM